MLKDFAIFGKSFTKNEHPQRHAQKGHTKTGCQCVICQNYFKILFFSQNAGHWKSCLAKGKRECLILKLKYYSQE